MNQHLANGGHQARIEALTAAIRERVGAELARWVGDADIPVAEREAQAKTLVVDALNAETTAAIGRGDAVLSKAEEEQISTAVLNTLFGLGGLQPLLEDSDIENIFVLGADVVFVDTIHEKGKRVGPVAVSDEALVDNVRMIGARVGAEERQFSRMVPELNIELPDGSRMHAVMGITPRPTISIRKHRYVDVTLADLVELNTMTHEIAAQLEALVLARFNVVIAGGTNAGKTTLLRAMARCIPPHERLLTVEDTRELGLHRSPAHPHVVSMQSRDNNLEGVGEVSQAACVRMGLRMSPDRVIVGEVRGAEVIPMTNAMAQGNDGSMTTVHAESTAEAFTTFARYAAQAPERLSLQASNLMIAGAVDVVVHVARLGTLGPRVITSIREVVGLDGDQIVSNEVYRRGRDSRAEWAYGWRAETEQRLVDAGCDPAIFQRWAS